MSGRVLLAAPRSFCAGVDRAIEIVEKLLEQHGPPVFVRHQIVHNDHVVKRLEGLEKIASSYRGIEKVFAIQAGREIRVIVTPEEVDDPRMSSLTEEIARRIEAELQYPGQIKVVLIRETRAVDFAR